MAARPPPQAARSVLDGCEHDGILTAETDDEATRATLQEHDTAPLPGRRTQISTAMADPVPAVYVRILTAANTGHCH